MLDSIYGEIEVQRALGWGLDCRQGYVFDCVEKSFPISCKKFFGGWIEGLLQILTYVSGFCFGFFAFFGHIIKAINKIFWD